MEIIISSILLEKLIEQDFKDLKQEEKEKENTDNDKKN